MKNSKRPFRPRASIFDTARRDTLGRLMARNIPDSIPRNIAFDNSLAHLYFRRGVDAILGQVDQVQQPHSRTARIGLRATAEQEGSSGARPMSTEFVLESACAAAEETCSISAFLVDEEHWRAFQEVLERPAEQAAPARAIA